MGVVITARVHPGETNSSWMMQGLIDFLTSECAHAHVSLVIFNDVLYVFCFLHEIPESAKPLHFQTDTNAESRWSNCGKLSHFTHRSGPEQSL